MRIRPYLIFWGLLNLLAGISVVLAPQRQGLDGSLRGVLDYLFGVGFLLASFLCLVAALLWSRSMQRHLAVGVIRSLRIVAQGTSLSVMFGWLALSIIAALVSTEDWLGVAVIVGLVWMQAVAIVDGDLTPTREAYIWQAAKKGG